MLFAISTLLLVPSAVVVISLYVSFRNAKAIDSAQHARYENYVLDMSLRPQRGYSDQECGDGSDSLSGIADLPPSSFDGEERNASLPRC